MTWSWAHRRMGYETAGRQLVVIVAPIVLILVAKRATVFPLVRHSPIDWICGFTIPRGIVVARVRAGQDAVLE